MGDMQAIGEQATGTVGGALTWGESFKNDFAASTPVLNNVGGDGSGGGNSDLERLIRLFTNEDTADIAERQLVVLRQVCKIRQRGFRYGELALVERLLPLVENRVSPGPQASKFRGSLLKLLDICSLAPVRDHANQEFTERGLTASSSLFAVLGGLLWSPDAGIQSATADVLRKIAAGNDPTRPNTPDDEKNLRFGECRDDLRPKPKDINQALLLGCGVVTSAVACLGTVIGEVLASLNELDEGTSVGSSSFDDGDMQTQGSTGDEVVQSMPALEATVASSPENGGEFDDTKEIGLDDTEEANSTATRADEQELKVNESVEGGDNGGGSSSNLALKQVVLLSLLQLVRELSTDADSSAAMVGEGLVTLLVQVIRAARGIRDPTLSITVEVMWNCLEHSQKAMDNGSPAESRTSLIRKARKTNATFALSNWNGISALRDAVESLFIGGFRNKDKELRNEAVIVASLLSSNGRSHPLFRNTGMLLLLLRYATAIETGLADGNPLAAESEARTFSIAETEGSYSGGSAGSRGDGSNGPERTAGVPHLGPLADPRNFATTKEVDMELKLLLWSLLADLCKRDARNVEVVNASPLMETLLMYMDLVVEEGHGGDAPAPGMSRSISLASMPPLGNSQQTNASAAMGNPSSTFPPVGGGETSTRHHSAAGSELGLAAAPFSGNSPTSVEMLTPGVSDAGQRRNGSKSESLSASSGQHAADYDSKNPVKENRASSGGGRGVDEAAPGVGGLTQLFVPASVFRLPVTSIQLLQGQAMASLLVLAPRCPRKFQVLGGHMVTLRLLDRLGNRPENQRLVKAATKMLATVVSLPGLKEELGRVDGVRIMLDRFSDEWKREQHGGGSGAGGSSVGGGGGGGGGGASGSGSGATTATAAAAAGGGGGGEGASDVRTDMVIILCRLCEECLENQEAFRKADGVPIMMTAVKAYCRARSEAKQQEGTSSGGGGDGGGRGGAGVTGSSSSGLATSAGGMESGGSSGESLDPSLVHIIDCVWCAVVGNRRSEARLLQCEGLDTLLDLLELCPVFMRNQVTGIVADLLRNKRSIPYARAWRSDLNMLSITQLMVRLWVAEESRLGVSRPNGVLQNLWEPLQSHDRGRGRRSLKKTPARHVRSRPTTGQGVIAAGTSTASGAGSFAADFRSSTTPLSGDRGSSGHVVALDGAAQTTPSADILSCAQFPVTSTSEAEEVPGSRGDHGDGTGAGNEANRGCSFAVALALEAGKRTVSGQCSGRSGSGGSGEQRKRTSQVGAEVSVAKAMTSLDLRGKIAAVLGMVGFDGSTTDGLGPTDLKASYMATSYMDFREGEAWQGVAAELEAQQTNPIAADALVLDTKLERAFDCAQEVKSKQMALTVQQEAREGEEEEAYFAGILFQRDQEIRQAIIKRNALMPGASKKRLAAKKAKADMLKRSSDRSHGESSGMGTGSDHGAPEGDFGNKEEMDTATAAAKDVLGIAAAG